MNNFWKLAAAVVVAASTASAQMPPQTIRVGTFHKPSIVVAFYRSPMWAERLKGARAAQDAARKANDTKKVEELEAWGSRQQELAHKQLEGAAPITNILEPLAESFPGVAQNAQVALIVSDVLYGSAMVQSVDVTEQLMECLKADEATRKIARELRARPAHR